MSNDIFRLIQLFITNDLDNRIITLNDISVNSIMYNE